MKTTGLIALSILMVFLFQSCKKDKEEQKQPVFAGIINDDLLYTELNPPLQVQIHYDTANAFHYGSDSLDINQDGTFDIIIKVGFFANDTIANPSADVYPFTSLTVRDSVQFASEIEYFPMGLGTSGKTDWIDTLNYNERIDNFKTWLGQYIHQFMWVVPPAIFWGSYGTWYDLVDIEKYIGLRMKSGSEYKYGWIRVKVISREEMQFISYAMQK